MAAQPADEVLAAARADARPSELRANELRGKLWIAYVLQIAAISVATLLSVYGAWIVLRDVLIQRALIDEAGHYWERLERDPNAPLPDTYNMQGFFQKPGETSELPYALEALPLGYNSARVRGDDDLVYVSETEKGRLYLVFDQAQVDRLALWFGFVPLSVVLSIIYLTTWLTYRVSRRAVSPVIWLADQVRAWDPKAPDLRPLEPANVPADADVDVRALAQALHGFATRIEEFVERERNFTRDASHELRSPLTVIRVAADVLLDDEELTPFAQRSVTRIRTAARDMEALTEAFLILAREADVGLPEEDFVVNEIAAEEVDKARALVAGKQVELRFVEEAQFALHAPPRVFAVMVSNLLRNACAYTDKGSVTVTIRPGAIDVHDTGVGMSEADLANVFRPFFRAGRHDVRGHGIGLSIVKRLSDRFGWPVALDSALGVGTRATITFPNPQAV